MSCCTCQTCPPSIMQIPGTVDVTALDFCAITPAQAICISQRIDYTELTAAQITDLCAALGLTLTVSSGPDADPANATTAETLDLCEGDTLHFHSPDGSIVFSVAPGSAIVSAQVDPALLADLLTPADIQAAQVDYIQTDQVCHLEPVWSQVSDASGASGGDTSIAAALGQNNGGRWVVPAGATPGRISAFSNHVFNGADGVIGWQVTNGTTGQSERYETAYIQANGASSINDPVTPPIDGITARPVGDEVSFSPGDVVRLIVTDDTTGASWRRSQPLGTDDAADWSWAASGQINDPSFLLYQNDPITHTYVTYTDRTGQLADLVTEPAVTGLAPVVIPAAWPELDPCFTDAEEARFAELAAMVDTLQFVEAVTWCEPGAGTGEIASNLGETATADVNVFTTLNPATGPQISWIAEQDATVEQIRLRVRNDNSGATYARLEITATNTRTGATLDGNRELAAGQAPGTFDFVLGAGTIDVEAGDELEIRIDSVDIAAGVSQSVELMTAEPTQGFAFIDDALPNAPRFEIWGTTPVFHTVNTYVDQDGTTTFAEVVGGALAPVDTTGWTICEPDLNSSQAQQVTEMIEAQLDEIDQGSAATDPASTEPGNLIIEGDDGDEYAMPLKASTCYLETLAPAPLAGLDVSGMVDDLSFDDLLGDVTNNTAGPVTFYGFELNINTWPATDRTLTVFLDNSASGTLVIAGGTPPGSVIFPLASPVILAPGQEIRAAISTSDMSGSQEVIATTALASTVARHQVAEYSDGETSKLIEFDAAGDPQELASIPAGWTVCGPFDDAEIAAIKELIAATPDLTTNAIDCYRNNIGVNQIQQDNDGRPIADGAMTWTPAANVTGDVVIRFDDPGFSPTYTVELAIDDGATTTVLSATNFGGGFYLFDFGPFSFVGGTTYTLTPSTATPGILIHDTIVSTQPAPRVEFVTPSPSGSIPNIEIVAPGADEFSLITRSDGTRYALDSDGNEIPADVANWAPCPPLSDEALETIENLIDEDTCPPIGVSEVLPSLASTAPTPGSPGTVVAPAAALALSQGVVGATRETPIQFHGRLAGEMVDAVIRVTRLGTGGGGIVLQPSGVFSNTSGATDHAIEIELANGLAFRWAVHAASAGGAENFIFNGGDVIEYAQGAGGIPITLPFSGSWSNANNSASSGFGFASANTLGFRSNGTAGAGSSFFIGLRDVSTLPEQAKCDRSASLLTLIEDNKPQCEVVGPAEQLDGASGTLADGTTWYREAIDDNAATAVTDGIGGDVRWTNSGILRYTFSRPVNFLVNPTTDPALGDPIVWTYVNTPPPSTLNGPWSRLISDGDPVSYDPGTLDLLLTLNTFGPAQADANIENSASGPTAQSDWGTVTAPNLTVVTVQGRDNEAMNFSAQPIETRELCDIVTDTDPLVGDGVHYRTGTTLADADYKLVNSVVEITATTLAVPTPGAGVTPGASVSIRNNAGADLTLSGTALVGDGDLVLADGEAAELTWTGTDVWVVS